MSASLFSPLALGSVELVNRIVVAPMCQYSANDGCATEWHLHHLMTLALSGAGLVMVEATAVERPGRITHGCLGLYSDDSERALGRVLAAARAAALPGARFGIQLSHAGRKGSAQRPWEGGGPLPATDDPWQTVAPSAIPHKPGWHRPVELDQAGLERITGAFVRAACRAARLGFDVIEVHIAHGYLLHQFHSPLANHRQDAWGGDGERRRAFPLAAAKAIRAAAPASVAVGARITGHDWAADGLTPADAVALAKDLKALGCSYVCVTSGGISVGGMTVEDPDAHQLPLAAEVRAKAGIATRAVGLIVTPEEADAAIREGRADQVAIARGFLDDPRWGWHAAERLGVDLPYPPQYAWAHPGGWPGAAARPGWRR